LLKLHVILTEKNHFAPLLKLHVILTENIFIFNKITCKFNRKNIFFNAKLNLIVRQIYEQNLYEYIKLYMKYINSKLKYLKFELNFF
jgi:hypothetical protein